MNIDVNSKITNTVNTSGTGFTRSGQDDSVKFSDELSNLSSKPVNKAENAEKPSEEDESPKESKNEEANANNEITETKRTESEKTEEAENNTIKEEADIKDENKETFEISEINREKTDVSSKELNNIMLGLNDIVEEINNKINIPENKKEEEVLINNDMNIPEQKDLQMFQMNANMNFNSDGQPFANFMNSQEEQKLSSSVKDLEEESAILSTTSENIAMANKNRVLSENELQNNQKVKTVSNSEGIKKVDKQSNITVETVVKFDTVIMNKDDAEFFAKLVENGQADMTQAAAKSSKISKTLADLLAKSMKDNQPVRIDFDNNISVIIKISRDGKISADFLPASQVAEAYLKENLPLLKQRFDDSNIEYDELNQRNSREQERQNKKKERDNE